MTQQLSLDTTLDVSGGANDEATALLTVRDYVGVLHVENMADGLSTSVDFYLEARLADDLTWRDWVAPITAVANGAGEITQVDLEGAREFRVRAVNNDGTAGNTAHVRAELETR